MLHKSDMHLSFMIERDIHVHLLARSTVLIVVAFIRLSGLYSRVQCVYVFQLHITDLKVISGEVAKLFADAGLICVASLISPYRRDRDTCRAMLPEENFIEVRLRKAFLIICVRYIKRFMCICLTA